MSVINPVISQTVRPVTNPVTRPPGKQGGGARNAPLTRDLEAWWDMSNAVLDGGETDSTGNFDLTTAGAGQVAFSQTVYRTTGVSRQIASGSSNYFLYSGNAPAALRTDGDFTFFIWVKPNDVSTRDLAGVWDETGNERGWRIRQITTGFAVDISTDGTAGTVSTLSYTGGGSTNWSFVCVTRKNNTLSLYVDDNAAVTTTISGIHPAAATFQIGYMENSATSGFLQGRIDACAMWSRALRGRDINERATSLYANGAGYAYADIGAAHGYATIAAAEASGDNWANGQAVNIATDGTQAATVEMLYFSALSDVGGLIHRRPYGPTGTELSAVTPITDEAAGVDPDSWSGWTDIGSGTAGVDYELTTNAGRAELRELSAAGRAFVEYTTITASDTETFLIVDDISAAIDAGGTNLQAALFAYINGTNYARIILAAEVGTPPTTWSAFNGSYDDLPETIATQRRAYIYVKDGAYGVWWSDGVAAASTGTPASTTTTRLANFLCGNAGVDQNGTLALGAFSVGRMTTA